MSDVVRLRVGELLMFDGVCVLRKLFCCTQRRQGEAQNVVRRSEWGGEWFVKATVAGSRFFFFFFPFRGTRGKQIWLQSLVISLEKRTTSERKEMMYKIAAELRCATFQDLLAPPRHKVNWTPPQWMSPTPLSTNMILLQLLSDSERELQYRDPSPVRASMGRWWCCCFVMLMSRMKVEEERVGSRGFRLLTLIAKRPYWS